MMTYIGAAILVVGFFSCLKLFKLIESAHQVINLSKSASSVMRNPELDDNDKEEALQRFSIKLFKLFFILLVGFSAALALPLGIIWGLEYLQLLTISAVLEFTLSWEFILASTSLVIVVYFILKKR